MNFICCECGIPVEGVWNGVRDEPISKYWKGQDIEEVYCGARCSLGAYDKRNIKRYTDADWAVLDEFQKLIDEMRLKI